MQLTVYLADLRHNYGGVLSTDCMPLSVGYMKAVMDRDLPRGAADVQIFAYPDDLLEAMRRRPPQVLMVGNYVWNEALGLFMLRRARQLNPDVLTVMGGPNISIEPDRQVEFVRQHPEIDVYALGEADFLACEFVTRMLGTGARRAMLDDNLPSCVRRRDGELIRSPQADRHHNINDIPSPWLTGVLDRFFDGKLSPIIETNRGCPFRCSFCVQGTKFYDRVTHFDLPRLEEEIRYIARMIRERSPHVGTLRIADANYGMYERDVKISETIGAMQSKYGWPTFIDATTGKNRPDRIIRSMEKLGGALVLYQAVQSLDDEVLRNVRRSNISLQSYELIQVHVRGRSLRSASDLILGLPGESKRSHLTALHKLIDMGTNQTHCFQAMMLKGADMESLQTRRTFKFDTRYRVLPKNYGAYGAEKVFDIEEVIVATDTLSFADYLDCRRHHLTFSIFWNDSWFSDVVQIARQFNIQPSEWLLAMRQGMEADTGPVRQLLDDFGHETLRELFPNREACAEFYARPENFQRLRRGDIGDNLMYKYRAKASFFIWPAVCDCAMTTTRRMLLERAAHERIPEFDLFWTDLHNYVAAKHASGQSLDEVIAPKVVTLRHDMQEWLRHGGQVEQLASYRLAAPARFRFLLTPEGERELTAAWQVWTSRLTGLTKLVTRIRIASQVRRCAAVPADAPHLIAN